MRDNIKENKMTIDEKLQFIAERIKDEKEFSIGSEWDTYRFINSKLRYVRIERTPDFSPMSLNHILSSPLQLKQQRDFTEDEKAILRNLPDEFRWIARDKSNQLWAYAFKPTKYYQHWSSGKGDEISLEVFRHLFKSIQWSDDEPCEFRKYI